LACSRAASAASRLVTNRVTTARRGPPGHQEPWRAQRQAG